MTLPPSPLIPSPVGGNARAPPYGGANHLLILADTGGSNGCRCWAWKTEIQSRLSNHFGLTVTVAHYPTGTSKWNPIEHRLFSEISKNWAGEPLDSYQKILNFMRTTKTQTGLAVTAYLDRTHYNTGVSPDPNEIRQLRFNHTAPYRSGTILSPQGEGWFAL